MMMYQSDDARAERRRLSAVAPRVKAMTMRARAYTRQLLCDSSATRCNKNVDLIAAAHTGRATRTIKPAMLDEYIFPVGVIVIVA